MSAGRRQPAGRGPRPRPRSGPPPTRLDPARRAAYDLLHAVGADDAYANLVLPGILRARGLTGRDAGFATELGYGTLRWRGLHDAVLEANLDRPLERIDPPLRDVLRLGSHQLLLMRVPPHAAVDESVALAREVAGEGASRLANAVLRKVGGHDRDAWVERLAPAFDADPAGHLALAWSHPRWIVGGFRDALLGSWDETRALLEADNMPARPTLVARPGRLGVEELLALDGVEPGRWSPYAATLEHGVPEQLAVVRDGRAGVQDEGSQLVALALARAGVDGADGRWLDLCAGPGGKAALLAGLAAERDAALLAVERVPHRATLVEHALAGAPGRHEVRVADATDPDWDPASFDRVLADVPCTGLGALRRRPESRWRRDVSDVAALGPLQRSLLSVALDSARSGGVVAYVTCSPHVAETDLVVEDVLRRRDDVTLEDATALLPEVEGLDPGPYVRLWPHRHGTDGMFLALLRRR